MVDKIERNRTIIVIMIVNSRNRTTTMIMIDNKNQK